MGKLRQKKKNSRRRINPIQRKGIQAGINEANVNMPVPTSEQVAPVVERVNIFVFMQKAELRMSNTVIDSFHLKTLLSVLGQQHVFQISSSQMVAPANFCCPKALCPF